MSALPSTPRGTSIIRFCSISFSEGYSWCVECIRQSVYASLATELEMNKVVEQLRQGRLDEAVEDLLAFNSKESKVASAASNNLALINILVGESGGRGDRVERIPHGSMARTSWRRPVSTANRHSVWTGTTPTPWSAGGTSTLAPDSPKWPCSCTGACPEWCPSAPSLAEDGAGMVDWVATKLCREALQVDASCTAAVFNLGLVCRAMGELEEAKRHFFKLNDMVMNSGQVLVQLAQM